MAQISVLLAAYNVERYVGEAVASLQAQTFQDLDIVAVDDCSTDGTSMILHRLAQNDRRIRVVSASRHGGIPTALNLGLTYCHAPYIARLDADDVALPERLQKQHAYLQESPSVALVGSAAMTIAENGELLGISRVPGTERAIQRTLLLGSPCYQIWLARKEVYDRLDGYRSLSVAEDYDFLLRAVGAGFRLANIPEPLTKVRIRSGSTAETAALKTRKAHHYVIGLHRERMRRNSDTFSTQKYEAAIMEGPLEGRLHRLAVRLSRKALHSSSRTGRLFYMALSALVSPWQARYFVDRARLKLALRNS